MFSCNSEPVFVCSINCTNFKWVGINAAQAENLFDQFVMFHFLHDCILITFYVNYVCRDYAYKVYIALLRKEKKNGKCSYQKKKEKEYEEQKRCKKGKKKYSFADLTTEDKRGMGGAHGTFSTSLRKFTCGFPSWC